MHKYPSGPIKIKSTVISPKLAKVQNHSAWRAWDGLHSNGVFYLADAVGSGKSFVALAVALGMWRQNKTQKRVPFRILVIAPKGELCTSWLYKLSGLAIDSEANDRIGKLAVQPGKESFFYRYLDEFRSAKKPDIAVYQMRRRYDAKNLQEALKEGRQKYLPILNYNHVRGDFRIEILITTPYWLNHGRNGGSGKKTQEHQKVIAHWQRWLRNADIIIGDEIFGARGDTVYGQILRPNEYENSPWHRKSTRPWLLGLSATMLSRDFTDAWGLFELAWGWKNPRYCFGVNNDNVFNDVRKKLQDFGDALKAGLEDLGPTRQIKRKKYDEKRKILENEIRQLITHQLSRRDNRRYQFWATGSAKVFNPIDQKTFPIKDDFSSLLKRLQESYAQDTSSINGLSWFIRAANEFKNDRERKSLNDHFHDWTAITEGSYVERVARNETERNYKQQGFRSWISEYYGKAEKEWLDLKKCNEFRFKVAMYLHRVATASSFRGSKGRNDNKNQKRIGEIISHELTGQMYNTCHKIAKHRFNKELFPNKKLEEPSETALNWLNSHNITIETLKKRNLTLLLAACLNANRANPGKKIKAFCDTIGDKVVIGSHSERYWWLLSRRRDIRRQVLNAFGAGNLVDWDERRRKEKGQKAIRSLSMAVFDPMVFSPGLSRNCAKFIDNLNNIAREVDFVLGVGKSSSRLTSAGNLITSFVETVVASIKRRPSWCQLIGDYAKKPDWAYKQLQREHEIAGSASNRHAVVEVLTGSDSQRRESVTRQFISPGNPFLLIMTNICSIGIDLHQYCWDIVHYTPTWTPHELEQKTGRIDRSRDWKEIEKRFHLARKKGLDNIRVHHLVWPFTYDERILSRVHLRSQYSERLLGSKTQLAIEDKIDRRGSEDNELHQFSPLDLEG